MGHEFWFVVLGLVIGAYGTLIGAGGGFMLMPVLLLLYPDRSLESLTGLSLAVVFVNAMSGSMAYARMKRIDFKSGLLFSMATIPGAVFGVLITGIVPRRLFDGFFGVLMVAVSLFLLLQSSRNEEKTPELNRRHLIRNLVEKDGTIHTYSFDPGLGVGLSFVVGCVSSLLGIGGGIVHVPVMVRLLNFPVHVATATSHFVLAVMALAATAVHCAKGSFSGGFGLPWALPVGVLVGAQIGAALSGRIHADWIIRGLAIALAFVGVRIFLMAF